MSEADSIKQQIKTAESIEEILEIVDKVLDMKNEKIHELEEENTTLRKANNITKNLKKEVKIEDITQVINKSYEEFIENFIPKQKVKDILQKNRNELFSTTYIDDKQYKPYTMQIDRINKIENEMLEDK